MRTRLLISVAIGIISGFYCWFLLSRLQLGAADFESPIRAAQALLAHQNPYAAKLQLYPITAALFGFPFVHVTPALAAAIFYGTSSALLAFGLTRFGYMRLLIFLAYPYWAGLLTAQWSPLLMAAAFFPLAMFAVLAKPQIGLPMLFTHPSKKGLIACLLAGALSLIAMPAWPKYWFGQLGRYDHFFPIFIFPGFLLVLSFLKYRDPDSLLLFFMACTPQRWFYDAFVLWLLPKSRREILCTVVISWGAGIWRWYHTPRTFYQVGLWSVLFFYLPMLVVVLLRVRNERASLVPARTGISQ
ncbi:MAG TPA: hypothetical protein VGF44_04840 [Terriglobales bacterium]